MTAVESCPACDRAQKRANRKCDWCDMAFDHVIEPPPKRWPQIAFALVIITVLTGLLSFASRALAGPLDGPATTGCEMLQQVD